METLKMILAIIGALAVCSSLGAVGMIALLKYGDRQWQKKQDKIDRACGRIPANDN